MKFQWFSKQHDSHGTEYVPTQVTALAMQLFVISSTCEGSESQVRLHCMLQHTRIQNATQSP